jgi:hypothetical protein
VDHIHKPWVESKVRKENEKSDTQGLVPVSKAPIEAPQQILESCHVFDS